MNYNQRKKIFKEIFKFCEMTWKSKGKDYASEDVLSNFKETARRYNLTPEQTLCVLMDKHNIAIQKYITKGQLKGESVEAKILDNINYMGMLLCLIKENKNDRKRNKN